MCMCVYSQSLRSICFAVWLGNGVETDRSKTTMFYDRFCGASPVAQWVQNPPAMQEMHPDMGLIPGLGRSLGREYGNPLLYSCLENPIDRGAWWATVHGVTKSRTWLKQLSMHTRDKVKWLWEYGILAWRIPMDRGAWQATVHEVAKSWTWLTD